MPQLSRAEKIAENKRNKRVETAYYKRCSRVQINIMRIGEVFKAGTDALAADPTMTDDALGVVVYNFVQTIRTN